MNPVAEERVFEVQESRKGLVGTLVTLHPHADLSLATRQGRDTYSARRGRPVRLRVIGTPAQWPPGYRASLLELISAAYSTAPLRRGRHARH